MDIADKGKVVRKNSWTCNSSPPCSGVPGSRKTETGMWMNNTLSRKRLQLKGNEDESQVLAAPAVLTNNINYQDQIPRTLEEFVRFH